MVFGVIGSLITPSLRTSATVNRQINFQGKVVNSNGTNIADGTYNMQFKIYTGGDGVVGGGDETLQWTEERLRNNSQGVSITDGIFQVNLGSVTTLPGSVDFNNDTLWLSINVGSTNPTCTPYSNCTPDGEMSPMVRFTAAPYAMNSDTLDGLDSTSFVKLAQGVQTDSSTTNPSIYINKTNVSGSPNILQLQKSSSDVFVIDNTGVVTAASTITIQGGTATLGTSSQGGILVLYDNGTGSENVTLNTLDVTTSYTLNLPTAIGSSSDCLKLGTVAGTVGPLTFGACGGASSLQAAYNGGTNIETASNTAVLITETTATSNTGDLLQLTQNAATGGTTSGDALQITLGGVDANANSGHGVHLVVNQANNTGKLLYAETSAAAALLSIDETGAFQLIDGSNGTPVLGFINDPDTGIYRVGTNNLGIALGGALVGDWQSAGTLAINSTSNAGNIQFLGADGSIEIGSGNDALSYIDFKGSANLGSDFQGRILYADGGYMNFYTGANSTNVRLQITEAGNVLFDPTDNVAIVDAANNRVGVNTAVPINNFGVSPLQYNTGTAGTGGAPSTTITGSGTTWTTAMIGSQIVFGGTTSRVITAVGGATTLTVDSSVTVTNGTAYTIQYPGLQVASTGNVGVGTTSPGSTRFVVDNQSTTDTIFEAKDAGSAVLSIADGGAVTAANNITIQGGTATLGTSSQGGTVVLYDNGTGSENVTINTLDITTSYTLNMPTAIGVSGNCLKLGTVAGTVGPLTFGSCGTGGAGSLQDGYDNSTDPEIVLAGVTGGVSITDDSGSPVSGNLLEVQNGTRTATYLGVASSLVYIQNSSGASAFSFDTSSGKHLKVYESGGSTNYADIYYDTSTTSAIFTASSGTTKIGSGSGDINLNTSAIGDTLAATHTGTAAGTVTDVDFLFTRNITGGSNNLQGSVLKIEDLSGTSGSSTPNLLYINQNNSSATGNLILAQLGGGSNDKFKVSTAGTVTIAAGQSYTGAGAVTVSSGASTALTLTGNAASTWSTSSGNVTIQAGGASKVIVKPGTDSASSFEIQQSGGTAFLTADSTNGRIGIGTASPRDKLEVGGAILIGAQADATAHNFASGCSCLLNSAAGTFGSETSRDAAVSSVVFKGKLFISTRETDAAGVYRYDGGTTWTLVTNSAGKAVTGDTANIDSFVLTVFNGALYIGSQSTANTGGLYASTTADTTADSFTLVNATRGSFGMSQTAVDGISDMAVWNGNLIISTQETNAWELGRYDGGTTFVQINTPDGEFISTDATDVDGALLVVYGARLFVGAITGSTTARVGYHEGIGTTLTRLNTTAGTFGAIASNIDITSMTIYNGMLYIATNKANAGAVYRWLLTPTSTNTTNTNFNMVSLGDGEMVSGDSANTIESYVLRTYNGRLYAGSTTGADGTAALYEYDGTKGSWTLINTTRGTYGAQTGVNNISSLQVFNGTLYVGTDESNVGSMYSWTKTEQNSYSLKFDSGSNYYGALSFVGSTQAVDNNGQYGVFRFSNSISLSSGAFDYAEDYPTFDESLIAGEPVSVDPSHPEHIKRARLGDVVLGVVSENPGFRLSAKDPPASGARWVPIALTGRVPVLVSTNGGVDPIRAGDGLALSSTPGVLVKAKSPGFIVGNALANYGSVNVGKVSMYVRWGWADPGLQASQAIQSTSVSIPTADPSSTADLGLANASALGLQTLNIEGSSNGDGMFGFSTNQITSQLDVLEQRLEAIEKNAITALRVADTLSLSSLTITGHTTLQDVVVAGNATIETLAVRGSTELQSLIVKGTSTFISDITLAGHIITGNKEGETKAVPKEAALCSTDPDTATPDVTLTGNDIAGTVTVTTTAGACQEGELIEVTFAKKYEKEPVVIISPRNIYGAKLRTYYNATQDGFSIITSEASTAETQYSFSYLIMQ